MDKDHAVKTTQAFYQGLRSGITQYAHWKDGVQYVGTTGKTLERALAEVAADEMRDLDEIRYYS